jgi:hypothetical protein
MTKKPARLIVAGIVFVLPLAALAQVAPSIAGCVKKITGEAVLRRGTDRMPVKEGMHILPHDVFETAAGASLGLILQDGTRVAMGANTSVEIDTFLYEPSEGKLGLLLRLARGVMVYVSGKIAQFSPGSVKVETPVGVVGLRGTEFAVSLEGH